MSPIHEHEILHARKLVRRKLYRRALLEVLPLPAAFAAIVWLLAAAGAPPDVWMWAVWGLVFYGGLGAWAVVEGAKRAGRA